MTEKLYYSDSHIRSFTATVLSCVPCAQGYDVELSATAFFPGGGGQLCDEGTLNGVRLLSVREEGEHIYHRSPVAFAVGSEVQGELDWDVRFRRMQLHSAEHIVSGLAHSRWGAENSGFHMNGEFVTMDLTVELTEADILWLETEANAVIYRNTPFRSWFPEKAELDALSYRSKKELNGAVRLVEVEGIDLCACCAPHVQLSGEIGSIRLLDAMRHRGGMRLVLRSGSYALEEHQRQSAILSKLSAALSVPQERISEAVEKLLATLGEQKHTISQLQIQSLAALADNAEPVNDALLFFVEDCDREALRAMVNKALEKCGLCAAFAGKDGAWQYILGSRAIDLRANAKAINAAIFGKGGGSARMIQGSATATRTEIEAFWEGFHG